MNAIKDFGLSDVSFEEFVDKDGNTIIHLVHELTRDGRSLANLLWYNQRNGKNFEWFPVTKRIRLVKHLLTLPLNKGIWWILQLLLHITITTKNSGRNLQFYYRNYKEA